MCAMSGERRAEFERMCRNRFQHDQEKYDTPEQIASYTWGARAGWIKYESNPVLGGDYGTCFDLSVLKRDGVYRMWFSWRPKSSIAYCESVDGLHFSEPQAVLEALPGSSWEGDECNRPTVLFHGNKYKMWYSGQMMPYIEGGTSSIGYAESLDGIHWTRVQPEPVLDSDSSWEGGSIMCPHVRYDEDKSLFEMWYSAGCNHEPDAIGYASSRDGILWEKHPQNPIFTSCERNLWEARKVAASHIVKQDGFYHMFYIGYQHEQRGSIGIARSKDGVTGWERSGYNPVIAPTKDTWDQKSVYKPCLLWDEDHWILWYNGADYDYRFFDCVHEQIGAAFLYRKKLWPDIRV